MILLTGEKRMSEKRNFDFVGKRKMAAMLSATLIVIGLLAVIINGGLNYNIEFNGGYLLQVGFKKQVEISDLRKTFHSSDIKGVQLQEFSDQSDAADFKSEVVIKNFHDFQFVFFADCIFTPHGRFQ